MSKNRRVEARVSGFQWDGKPEGATEIINWILHNGGTARYHEARPGKVAGGYRVEIPRPAKIVIDGPDGKSQHLYAENWVVLTNDGLTVAAPSDIDFVMLYTL